MKEIPVGKFKSECLSILGKVHEKEESYVLTKHGKPIARVIPYHKVTANNPLKDSIVFQKDIVEPLGEQWESES